MCKYRYGHYDDESLILSTWPASEKANTSLAAFQPMNDWAISEVGNACITNNKRASKTDCSPY